MRPTLTYMDVLLRKSGRRSKGGAETDSDEDDGPPPDPDDPALVSSLPKKDSKSIGEAKEVQVTVRKSEDKNAQTLQGGLSSARREMLRLIREEEDEEWQDIDFWDGEVLSFSFKSKHGPLIHQLRVRKPKLHSDLYSPRKVKNLCVILI